MAVQKRTVHGIFSIHVEGRMLVLHSTGPSNRELVEELSKAEKAALAELAGAPWGLLATITDEVMHTPESYAAMVETIRRHREMGRCATAVIFDHVFGDAMVRRVLERMYHEAGETAQFFDDEASARAWLLDQIEQAEKSG